MAQQGHRHIALLKENGSYYQLQERYNAYRHALKDAGIPYKKHYVATGDLTINGGYQAAKAILLNPEVTAIFCSNDAMAIGCYRAIYELGKKVPEEISVIGFDDIELTASLAPALTTVQQPIFEIGFTAAKFLIDAIEFPERRMPNKIFETKLILRESVNKIAKSPSS